MSRFTRYRKIKRLEKQKRFEHLVESCEKLETFTKKVQKLYEDHPDFELKPNDPESMALWNKYTKDYYDSLTEEFA